MENNLISYLKTNINYLTAVERRIAQIIVDTPDKFITYTMLDLAQYADVSQGSIINFSKKFAGGGFPELKLMIAANLKHYSTLITDSEPLSKDDILSKTISAQNAAYLLTSGANSEETLARVAEKILNAKKVENMLKN